MEGKKRKGGKKGQHGHPGGKTGLWGHSGARLARAKNSLHGRTGAKNGLHGHTGLACPSQASPALPHFAPGGRYWAPKAIHRPFGVFRHVRSLFVLQIC